MADPYRGESSLTSSTAIAVVNGLQFPQSHMSFNSRPILFCCMSISTRAITGVATLEGEVHALTDTAMALNSKPFIFSLEEKQKKMPILFSKWQIAEFFKQL